jgi:D-alanyl-D-alanine carboxypeptidase
MIYDLKRNIALWSKHPEFCQEVASLTKIMTTLVVLQMCEEWEIDMHQTYCRVSKRGSEIGGTSAFLKEGLRFSVYDLLHGLMLPSGNDAALVLSEHFGRLLHLYNCKSNQ